MAEALMAPLIKTGIQPPSRISVHDVSTHTMDRLAAVYGSDLRTESSIHECVLNADLIVCAVKPQNTDLVFREIRTANVDSDSTLLSVIAGKPISSFVAGTGMNKIVRSMPNTPATIGKVRFLKNSFNCMIDHSFIHSFIHSFNNVMSFMCLFIGKLIVKSHFT